MDTQKLREHFDVFTDFPGGVQALRDQIMLLMLQGKLVAHDPGEGNAAELLTEIRSGKEAQARGGELPEPAAIPALAPEDLPFELPAGWAWSRWGEVILELEEGNPHPPRAEAGDLVIARKGDAETVGRSVLVEGSEAPALPVPEVLRLHMPDEVDSRFFHLANNSFAGRAYYASLAQADGPQQVIEATAVTHMPFPIPPRGEQTRLVSRVEELMALCDELERRQGERNAARKGMLQSAALELLAEG